MGTVAGRAVRLLKRVTCPHCWKEFLPEDVHWVSTSVGLLGDPRLGPDAQLRFLPDRFDPACRAIDPHGGICSELACPRCHLTIPRACLELAPVFVSILGAPGVGKTYFLAAAVWQLRKLLRERFYVEFADASPQANVILNSYEERLFLNPRPDEPVALEKTEKEGHLYQSVRFGDRTIWYPRPFLFVLRALDEHPAAGRLGSAARLLSLYDNAGEHFLPGGEGPGSAATHHLARSSALLFLFDPLQHAGIREQLRSITRDPQATQQFWSYRQDVVLTETAERIRNLQGLPPTEPIRQPLIVVVTKWDAVDPVLPGLLDAVEPVKQSAGGIYAVDEAAILEVSDQVRRFLLKCASEFVHVADAVARKVIFVPVSALGSPPELIERGTGRLLGVRPRNIRPRWAEVPLLYALFLGGTGLIPRLKRDASGTRPGQEGGAA